MIAKKEIVILAGTRETRKALANQLDEIIGDLVNVKSYSVEEQLPPIIENQIIIFSSYLIDDEVKHIIGNGCKIIIANRTINYQFIDKLLFLPKETKVLYVNDFPETVSESIHTLKKLGIDHIHYVPYYPGKLLIEHTEIAVTPGEVELVPPSISQIVDIGVRLIDITTIIRILDVLQFPEENGLDIADKYTKKIIELSQKLAKTNNKINLLNRHLKEVVDGVNDGILAFTYNGKITVFNEVLEKLTGVSSKYAIGQNIRKVLKNHKLIEFLFSQTDTHDQYFSLKDTDVMVHRFHLLKEQSIVATFKNVNETIEMERAARNELVKKGYIAKYSFSDIIGNSLELQETKIVSMKLARTDLAILIQGESGTGKELFASAIHNESPRKTGPFLAVNFSALPEDLLESELFGYEDGAFTGAKKGGKKGLFEQADGGTIFLDEIGDISPKLQARLLRVLQEKEIRRVGGSRNIPINVRVIAATNKDLISMINHGTFREDLYHRLKVLFIELPPLRKRKGDLPVLIKHFIEETNSNHVDVSKDAIQILQDLPWYGNVRELKNTIDYMLAVHDGNVLNKKDIPGMNFFQRNKLQTTSTNEDFQEKRELSLSPEQEMIIEIIYKISLEGKIASRKSISEYTTGHNQYFELSEQQVRQRIQQLEELGFVTIGVGRSGTRLSRAGLDYVRLGSFEKAL
ncbi:sigma 54-interacting transcriptional regulator [Cytobacillus sp. FJAT-54145]|uniref:Sigma 54-interacting transcriptional regulator n=1 Tax=Cytobacillus spartinae TaxID=3299023 RepID=A0ABW6KA37_9BACI